MKEKCSGRNVAADWGPGKVGHKARAPVAFMTHTHSAVTCFFLQTQKRLQNHSQGFGIKIPRSRVGTVLPRL